MDSSDQSLGELQGKFEMFSKQSSEDRKMLWEHIEANQKEMIKALNEIRDELSAYKTAIKVVRWIGAIIAALLMFKFGDVSHLWNNP